MGLQDTERISRIRVHPTNPDIVYACALGHTYGPQSTRGVYRTEDGGESWELVLHVAYWKYAVRRRLVGDPSGTFRRKPSNWPDKRMCCASARWHSVPTNPATVSSNY